MSEMLSAHDLSREALFALVWAEPMTQLAQRFGLSDQGLRKICVNLQVPLPKAGHWAKAAVGRTPPRPALSPFSEKQKRAQSAEKQRQRANAKAVEVAAWQPPAPLAEDEAKAPRTRWHPVVRPIKDGVEEYVKKMRFSKQVFDWEASHPGKRYPGKGMGVWMHPDWQSIYNGGQVVSMSHKTIALRVSMQHYERGLKLLNAVVSKAEKQGYAIDMDEQGARGVRLTRGREHVLVRIHEKMTQRKEEQDWFLGKKRLTQVLVPSGRLSIVVEHRRRDLWEIDEPGRFLEDRIDRIVMTIGEMMDAAIKSDALAAQQQREREERARIERERLAVEAAERMRVEQLVAAEASRRQALLEEAKRWKDACLLREYLAVLDDRVSDAEQPAEEFQRWKQWAMGVANEMDVTLTKPLLQGRC